MELFGLFVMLGVPGYFALQAYLLYCLRGGWLIAAAVPLVPMAAVVAYTVHAFNKGSNWFPLVLIFTAPIVFVYLLVVFGLWRLLRCST